MPFQQKGSPIELHQECPVNIHYKILSKMFLNHRAMTPFYILLLINEIESSPGVINHFFTV